ncbi:hypothetical protein RQ479_06210 [Mesorhizobium sp. ISC25]|uniref:hypothetical protein n=1 Tax=Mesorhizobium sp. ISC25 TaxID=3077335 RepID=UPI0035DFAD0B
MVAGEYSIKAAKKPAAPFGTAGDHVGRRDGYGCSDFNGSSGAGAGVMVKTADGAETTIGFLNLCQRLHT